MRKLEGRIHGPLAIREDTSLHGKVEGDVPVGPDVLLLMHGMIAGDLHIEPGATVELRGMVSGSSRNRGRLDVYGVVRGFMHDEGDGHTRLIAFRESRDRRDRDRDRDRDWDRDREHGRRRLRSEYLL